jgi:HD-GYP domain-containing protein (c-di-GMP phosphodiesterase class II)
MDFLRKLRRWLFAPRVEDLEQTQEVETGNHPLKKAIEFLQNRIAAPIPGRTPQSNDDIANLERARDISLEVVSESLDAKVAEPSGHSKRVTAFSIAIARKMSLAKPEIFVIARGAFLHDVGKMAIPDEILRKPSKLTSKEMARMRGYVGAGYRIVGKLPSLVEAAEIVYAHQEWYDGTGYPRGLRGDEIPLGARIVAIANTLEVITSGRPYRPARTLEAAREEIEKWSGRQFDPKIVRVFLAIPDSVWRDLRSEID